MPALLANVPVVVTFPVMARLPELSIASIAADPYGIVLLPYSYNMFTVPASKVGVPLTVVSLTCVNTPLKDFAPAVE